MNGNDTIVGFDSFCLEFNLIHFSAIQGKYMICLLEGVLIVICCQLFSLFSADMIQPPQPVNPTLKTSKHPNAPSNPQLPKFSIMKQLIIKQLIMNRRQVWFINNIRVMRVSSSRINRQQQVKVVVRLKPQPSESRYSKYVYLSDHDENQLVVQTGSKKDIFMFDHIAHELTTQQEIYRMICQDCVSQAFEGYNCCIFAYGQTGAGKTYSVLGNLSDLQTDPYSQSRGILPRLLQEVFEMARGRQEGQKVSVTCAYMEIYNQQIFDLLSSDKRIHQIREDAKKGVFVEGLIQRKIMTYRSAMGLLLEGEKTRKTAFTQMNTESSRSHAIFSILIQSEMVQNETITTKKAKLHIVDLAGSERVKHTNVEGQRLREGCNINRSLHVLGNVINCLAESSKKKKHIPFRDSKLTHYLKDSLGGNSITKLLANIHTGRQFFGDTLSTLMFAKRAKLLKMKVQLNETTAQNFDSLRKEIRKLRQQLAQAKYFKTEGRMSERGSFQPQLDTSAEKINPEHHHHQTQTGSRNETLRILQENEIHYKALIEIYEEHMKTCLSSSHIQRKQNINIVKEWKNLEKRNISLTHLVKQLPLFTTIYKENLLLRQERFAKSEPLFPALQQKMPQTNGFESRKESSATAIEEMTKVVDYYEDMMSEMQQKFNWALQTLQKTYFQLQNECKLKQKKIKDLKQKWEIPPDLQELKNENDYLHLNILNLQNEIEKLQQKEQKLRLELKQSKRGTAKKDSRQDITDQEESEQTILMIQEQVYEIRREAEKESAQIDVERAEMQMVIQKLQAEINKYMVENSRLREKYSKSKSRRRSHSRKLDEVQSLKHNMVTPDQKEYIKSEAKYINNSAVTVSAFDSHSYTKEILTLKMDIKRKQKEIADLRKELDEYVSGDRKIEEEFGKTLEQVIEEYRSINERRMLHQSKSVKIMQTHTCDEKADSRKMRESGRHEQPRQNRQRANLK